MLVIVYNNYGIRAAALGPLVNSEYYPGWDDEWGELHHTQSASVIAESFDNYLSYQNASINVYMAHGGTSFGFEAGMLDIELKMQNMSYYVLQRF